MCAHVQLDTLDHNVRCSNVMALAATVLRCVQGMEYALRLISVHALLEIMGKIVLYHLSKLAPTY
jgi:hypothetical protein